MPVSARKVAGIIRNVLPKKLIERRPSLIILGSREELIARRAQISKWEKTKTGLMSTPEGRKYLSKHFPKSYQRALIAERTGSKITARQAPTLVKSDLGQLYPHTHERIMQKRTPQLPQIPNFMVGLKKVYLPNFVVTLRRNPRLEPYFAVFDVPLNFSKLDLMDYLWHLYGVKSLSIRSQVLPGKLRRKWKVKDQPVRVGPWVRTTQRKKMIVQLAKPFRYPKMLDKGELREYKPHERIKLIVGFRRNGMIRRRGRINRERGEGSTGYRIILILCTMYTINGVRQSIASITPSYTIRLIAVYSFPILDASFWTHYVLSSVF